MSLNKVKSFKSKKSVGGNLKVKMKISNLRFLVKKTKTEKLVMMEEIERLKEVETNQGNVGKKLKEKVDCMIEEIGILKKNETKHCNFFEKLRENVECPVCMEIPRTGPIFSCSNGHFVCKKCKRGSCPTCRIGMEDGKSLLAITVIENIEHKCKFVECKEIFAGDKAEAHEQVCKYNPVHRIVKCPECSEEIELSKMLTHFKKFTCCSGEVPTVINTSSGQTNFLLKKDRMLPLSWSLQVFSYRKKLFVIRSEKSGDYYHFTMVMFESKEVCSKIKIEMSVHVRGSSSKDSEVGLIFRGSPCSVDQNKSEVKYRGLNLHHKQMEEVIQRSQTTTFTVSFSFS